MKRLAELQGYIDALFNDLAPIYLKASELRRDHSRLSHETEVHGLKVLTIDLPSISKHFDMCLGRGLYTQQVGGYLSATLKGEETPKFLRDLYLQIFDNDGKLRSAPNVNAILAVRQVYKGMSKLKLLCEHKEIVDEVVNFATNDRALRSPDRLWGGSYPDFSRKKDRLSFLDLEIQGRADQGDLFSQEEGNPLSKSEVIILERVCDYLSGTLGCFHSEGNESDRVYPKHGTGRVSDQPKGGDKYVFPSWSQRLESVFPFDRYGCVNHDHAEFLRESDGWPLDKESPSRLIAVPKTMKGPRLIASEPTSGQWLQQLVWNQLQKRMSATVFKNCVDFRDQTHNQRLALSSSRSGSHATIDLSSASDRLSLWTLERALRSNESLLDRIYGSRTRYIRNEIAPLEWDYILLKKAFSQGNACTFPVQSLVYSMFAIAAYIIKNDMAVSKRCIEEASRSVRVFGDDLIVPVDCFETMARILTLNQLVVNESKTFHSGGFRESCGVDAYDGVNVTPTYIKSVSHRPDHETFVSCLESSNNLFQNGWWHLSEWQASLLGRKRNLLPITKVSDENTGLTCFSGKSSSHLPSRWNSDYQRGESLSLVLKSKNRFRQSSRHSELLQYFIEAPDPEKLWISGTLVSSSSILKKSWNEQR